MSAVKIVFNRILGGWYVVRGPHQTPLSTKFDTKADAQAWLDRRNMSDRPQNLNPKGIRVSVYRNAAYGGTGCTNGGVSGDHTRLTVVGVQRRNPALPTVRGAVLPLPTNCQVFEADDDAPAVVLRESNLRARGYPPVLVPYDIALDGAGPHGVGPMFGGNYAGASDSRFTDLVRSFDCPGADLVPIHDRVETPEQYRALST